MKQTLLKFAAGICCLGVLTTSYAVCKTQAFAWLAHGGVTTIALSTYCVSGSNTGFSFSTVGLAQNDVTVGDYAVTPPTAGTYWTQVTGSILANWTVYDCSGQPFTYQANIFYPEAGLGANCSYP